jgi:hypothetical protein
MYTLSIIINIFLALSTTLMPCNTINGIKILHADNELETIVIIKHTETTSNSPNEISLPYKKYVLENDLAIIIHE